MYVRQINYAAPLNLKTGNGFISILLKEDKTRGGGYFFKYLTSIFIPKIHYLSSDFSVSVLSSVIHYFNCCLLSEEGLQ